LAQTLTDTGGTAAVTKPFSYTAQMVKARVVEVPLSPATVTAGKPAQTVTATLTQDPGAACWCFVNRGRGSRQPLQPGGRASFMFCLVIGQPDITADVLRRPAPHATLLISIGEKAISR
jgi:hypothetical protein